MTASVTPLSASRSGRPAISRVEAIPIAIPTRKGEDGRPLDRVLRRQQRGLVYSTHGETVFVKITAEDGTVGWGERLASVAPARPTAVCLGRAAGRDSGRDRGWAADRHHQGSRPALALWSQGIAVSEPTVSVRQKEKDGAYAPPSRSD